MRPAIEGDATVVRLLSTTIHGVIRRRHTRTGLRYRERDQRAVRTNGCSCDRQRAVNLDGFRLGRTCISGVIRCQVAYSPDAICCVRNRGGCTCDGCRRCSDGVLNILDATSALLIRCGNR